MIKNGILVKMLVKYFIKWRNNATLRVCVVKNIDLWLRDIVRIIWSNNWNFTLAL